MRQPLSSGATSNQVPTPHERMNLGLLIVPESPRIRKESTSVRITHRKLPQAAFRLASTLKIAAIARLSARSYAWAIRFSDLRKLFAKANEEKSGDLLAPAFEQSLRDCKRNLDSIRRQTNLISVS